MNLLGLGIHAAMLADEERNQLLARAVRSVVRPGDRVVDVGTGSGLLAMIAVQAGAAHVDALDASSMAVAARKVVARNGMADRIDVHQTHSRHFELSEPADVVLCETIGFCALDEGYLSTLVDARERFLKPGGRILPESLSLWAAPAALPPGWVGTTQLDQIEGFDMGDLAQVFRRVHARTHLPVDRQLGPAQELFCWDSLGVQAAAEYTTKVQLACAESEPVAGILLWFESRLAPKVSMGSRSPEPQNHWGQAFLPLPKAIPVQAGDVLDVEIGLVPPGRDAFRVRWSVEPAGIHEFVSQHG